MVSILANLALKTEHELVPAGGGRARGPDRAVAQRRGDRQHHPERLPAVRRALGVRPQGRRPRRGRRQGRAARTSTSSRRSVGNAGRLVVSELGGRANTSIRARQLGHELEGVDRSARAVAAHQAARVRGPRVRGRRGVVRAADPPPRGRLRRAVPDRRLHLSRRAARRPRAARRGHASRSRSTARRCTPRPTATARSTRSTPRCARRCGPSTRPSTTSTSSTTRSASSTATRPPRPARG